ncbi:hypothetical protein HanRHA438_Chr04g0189331 [Helianthus annuus]|nr:hypothetical protein HanIR_Chr04g0193381 [Helianthus annuus]KAJ0928011.1 hypothetical protein HanRHA438_Chr04g0189331 [Helianthus annuus]
MPDPMAQKPPTLACGAPYTRFALSSRAVFRHNRVKKIIEHHTCYKLNPIKHSTK